MQGVLIERGRFAVGRQPLGTGFQHFLDGSFQIQDMAAGRGMQRRHKLALRLEGDDILPRQLRFRVLRGQPRLRGGGQKGAFRRIAFDAPEAVGLDQARIVAQQSRRQRFGKRNGHIFPDVRAARNNPAVRGVAVSLNLKQSAARENPPDGHLVFRKRAGLVRTNHGRAAKRFHRGKFADNGPAFGHPAHADRQRNRHGGRQPLGNRAHGQRHRRHEHVDRAFAAPQAHAEGERRQRQNRHQQHLAEGRNFLGERRGEIGGLRDHFRNTARFRGVARGDDDRFRLAVGDQRARVRHVAPVGQNRFRIERLFLLNDRHRFAGERRFVHLQIPAGKQARVGGHLVAGLKTDNVAHHQMDRIDLEPLAVAQHSGLRGHHLFERFDGFFGLGFLNETDEGVDENDAQNHRRVHPLLQQQGHCTRGQQDVHQRLMKLQ